MDDALILEDGPTNIDFIKTSIPVGIRYVLVRNTLEFRNQLADGYSARFYFLDDRVPDENGIWDSCFIRNCDFLLGQRPDAKVFYTGSTIRPVEELYCFKHKIGVMDRREIAEFLESHEQETSF